LDTTGVTFDGTKFISVYQDLSVTGREITRKLVINNKDTKVIAPVITDLSV
jgi:hypothetical protein